MKISIAERMTNAAISGMNFPELKGTATITLTDPKTGKRERVTDSNMVTDAVKKVFEMNYLGMADFNSLLAIKTLFGGCFLFNKVMTESVNTIWPPNSTDNNLVARCGQTPHSTGDRRRGHPTDPEITDNHIKFIFDWNLDEGNGTINNVCLTHALAGDIGINCDGTGSLLRNYSRIENNKNSFALRETGDNTLSRNRLLSMPFAFDTDGNGLSLVLTSTGLEEITVAHSFIKANLLENGNTYPFTNFREISTRSATLSRTFNTSYTLIGQDALNYYVMERDSANNAKLYIDVISKTDMSVTSEVLEISGATLARTQNGYAGAGRYAGIVSGGAVYWVSGSDAKTFVKIPIDNPADVEVLASDMTANLLLAQQAFNMSDGLVLGANFLINGERVYPVARRVARNPNSAEVVAFDMLAAGNGGPALLLSGFGADNAAYYQNTQGGEIALPYLATCCNLNSSVQKNNSKTMRLEYVLTQV